MRTISCKRTKESGFEKHYAVTHWRKEMCFTLEDFNLNPKLSKLKTINEDSAQKKEGYHLSFLMKSSDVDFIDYGGDFIYSNFFADQKVNKIIQDVLKSRLNNDMTVKINPERELGYYSTYHLLPRDMKDEQLTDRDIDEIKYYEIRIKWCFIKEYDEMRDFREWRKKDMKEWDEFKEWKKLKTQ
jgi:hypothetical protein